jgi:GNAT superfamily N-acetyltransferase
MSYARLSNNSLVYLREIRAEDKERLAAAMRCLSPESIQKRFLGPKPSLSAKELRYLTEVDGVDHYAVVAVSPDNEEQFRAVARFVRSTEDPAAAEIAITVCDDMQGKGLGGLLARRLSDAARERGIERLTASISSENRPALKLMRRIGERMSGRVGSSVTELVAQLPVAPAHELGEEAAAPTSAHASAASAA